MPAALRLVRNALLLALGLVGVLVATARRAAAEEALVLDNGAVLRGEVLHEERDTIEFRLSGVGTDSRITIRRERIVRRFVTVDRESAGSRLPVEQASQPAPTRVEDDVAEAPPPPPLAAVRHVPAALPAEEPRASEESFIARTTRLAVLAFPRNPFARALCLLLGVVVLLCLVGLGGKMADVEGLDLAGSATLAGLLGVFLVLDAVFAEHVLKASTASWVLPLEVVAWIGAAAGLVRCGVARATVLLAFVLFCGTLVTFASGAVLVSV
jgi:hypothetical protein